MGTYCKFSLSKTFANRTLRQKLQSGNLSSDSTLCYLSPIPRVNIINYKSLETCLAMALLHYLRPIANYVPPPDSVHTSDYNYTPWQKLHVKIFEIKMFQCENFQIYSNVQSVLYAYQEPRIYSRNVRSNWGEEGGKNWTKIDFNSYKVYQYIYGNKDDMHVYYV